MVSYKETNKSHYLSTQTAICTETKPETAFFDIEHRRTLVEFFKTILKNWKR